MSFPPCPKCNSEYVYEDQNNLVCPECAHEWDPNAVNNDDVIDSVIEVMRSEGVSIELQ